MKNIFNWFRKHRYTDGEVELIEAYSLDGTKSNGYISSIVYHIRLKATRKVVGRCDLRIGMNDELFYAGNIGYQVKKAYRGHHYAYKACRLLFQIAKEEYIQKELWITCNPDNIPSRKTCERLNGDFRGIVEVPEDHWLIQQGDSQKRIYYYQL